MPSRNKNEAKQMNTETLLKMNAELIEFSDELPTEQAIELINILNKYIGEL